MDSGDRWSLWPSVPASNSWNWPFAMPVESDDSGLSGFYQVGKGVVIAPQNFETTSNSPRFRALLLVNSLMCIGFLFKETAKGFAISFTGSRRS